MKIDKDLLLHHLLLSDNALGAIVKERDELRNESDELLGDLIDSEKERDEFQAKLDMAVEAFIQLRDTDIDDADRFINDVLKRMEGK
jgi:uncharacterized coiled-coil DUF342 family protein